MEPTVGLTPLSIKIESCQIGPKVTINHAIRVDHGNNNESIFLQYFGVGYELIDKTLQCEGAYSFTWMLASQTYNMFFSLILFVAYS